MNKKTNKKRVLAIAGTGLLATNTVGGILISNHLSKTSKAKAYDNGLIDKKYTSNLSPEQKSKIDSSLEKVTKSKSLEDWKNTKKEIEELPNCLDKFEYENKLYAIETSEKHDEQVKTGYDLVAYNNIKEYDEIYANELILCKTQIGEPNIEKKCEMLVNLSKKKIKEQVMLDHFKNDKKISIKEFNAFYSKHLTKISDEIYKNKLLEEYKQIKESKIFITEVDDFITKAKSQTNINYSDYEQTKILIQTIQDKDLQSKLLNDIKIYENKVQSINMSKVNKKSEGVVKLNSISNDELQPVLSAIEKVKITKRADDQKNVFDLINKLPNCSYKFSLIDITNDLPINIGMASYVQNPTISEELKKQVDIVKSYNEIKELETKINKEQDGKDKYEILEKLALIKPTEFSTMEKINSKTDNTELQKTKEIINKMNECEQKTKFLDTISKLETKIKEDKVEVNTSIEKLTELRKNKVTKIKNKISDSGFTPVEKNSFHSDLNEKIVENVNKINDTIPKVQAHEIKEIISELPKENKEKVKEKPKVLVNISDISLDDKKDIKNVKSEITKMSIDEGTKKELTRKFDERVEVSINNLLFATNFMTMNAISSVEEVLEVLPEEKQSEVTNKINTKKEQDKKKLEESIKDKVLSKSEIETVRENINFSALKQEEKQQLLSKLDTISPKQEITSDKEQGTHKKPMTKEEFEQLKQQCTSSIGIAEGSNDIKDISKARDLVNKLPEGKDKEELQTKLNNIEIKGFDESTKSNVTGDMDVVVESNPTIEMTLSTNLLNIKDYNGLEDIEIPNAFSITVSSGLSFNLNVQALDNLKNDKGNTIPIEHMTLKAHEGKEITVSKDKKETLVTNHKHGKDIKFDFDVKLKADSSIVPDIYKTTLKFEASQK